MGSHRECSSELRDLRELRGDLPLITWQDVLRPGDATNFFEAPSLPQFVPETSAYEPANAWWLAELCRLVYRQDVEESSAPLEPRRTSILERVGMQQVAFFNGKATGTQAFLVESSEPRYLALVFRGTEQDPRDLLCDLEIGPPLPAGPRIHKGFERAFQSVWSDIAPVLEGRGAPLFYAGHSLGGALALLAATRRPPQAVYVCGCPRAGNAAFAAQLANVPVHRVVHGDDMVSVVPPEVLGFRHVGDEHRIGVGTHAAAKFDAGAMLRDMLAPPKPLADHAPINYVRALLAQCRHGKRPGPR